MASRTTSSANVKAASGSGHCLSCQLMAPKRTSHPEGTDSAPQFNNPEQMLVRGLNAAWIAFPPKASCIDGLSVPHTGAVPAVSIVVNIDQPRIGVLGQNWLHRRPNRQLSATERSELLPPNTEEASCPLLHNPRRILSAFAVRIAELE